MQSGVGGKPFLDIVVDELVRQGLKRIIFCVGHLKEQIIDRYAARSDAEYRFSAEEVALGTGGAVIRSSRSCPIPTFPAGPKIGRG